MKTSIVAKSCHSIKNKMLLYKYSLCSTWIIALLTYTFSFVHKLPNHDDIICFFNLSGAGIGNGRWMLNVIDFIMPSYSMPLVNGILSIILLSVAICYTIKIFKIENVFLQILLSGIIISFQSVVGMMAYTFLNYSYALSFLLSVLAINYVLKNGWKNYVAGTVMMVVSMGIYQAYWAIGVVFLLCLLIQDTIRENSNIKNEFPIRSIKYILFIILTACIYYIINYTIFYFLDLQWGGYASERVDNINTHSFITRLYWAAINVYSCLRYGIYGFVVTWLSKIIHFILLGCICCGIIIPLCKKREWGKIVLSIFLLMLFPIAINVMYIITPIGVHSLTLLPFIGIYILAVVVTERNLRYIRVYDTILISLILLLVNNVLIANKNQMKQYMQYENAKSFYTGVMVRIGETKGFDKDTQIALIGKADELVWGLSDFVADGITGISDGHIMNIHSRESFIKYFVGFDAPFTDIDENKKIVDSTEFKSMPVYPYDGSVKKIGNVIVVKFSDVTDL